MNKIDYVHLEFIYSRLERNAHGKWEFVAYYKVV